jgi:hypothetical protein
VARFRLTPQGRVQLSENDVRTACLDLLRARQWWPIRQHVGKFHPVGEPSRIVTIGQTGDPDYVVVKAPSFFLETKRPGGGLRDGQRERIDILRQFYGLDTAVVDSVEDLVDWLDRHMRSP